MRRLLVLLLLASTTEAAEKLDSVPTYTAGYVASQYVENEVAANKTFEGRQLILTGTVESVQQGLLSPFVVLKGYKYRDVQCMFSQDAADSLTKFTPGARATIVGTCRGEILGNPMFGDCVVIDNINAPFSREGQTLEERRGASLQGIRESGKRVDEFKAKLQEEKNRKLEAEQRRQAEADAAEQQRLAEEEAKFRVWTSATGKHTVKAKLISFTADLLTLERRDSRRIKVSLDKLHQADRDFVAKWRRDKLRGQRAK